MNPGLPRQHHSLHLNPPKPCFLLGDVRPLCPLDGGRYPALPSESPRGWHPGSHGCLTCPMALLLFPPLSLNFRLRGPSQSDQATVRSWAPDSGWEAVVGKGFGRSHWVRLTWLTVRTADCPQDESLQMRLGHSCPPQPHGSHLLTKRCAFCPFYSFLWGYCLKESNVRLGSPHIMLMLK